MARKTVVQTHHISYNPEVTVTLYKGEHWILTQLGRRKHVSRGFLTALALWISTHGRHAEELEKNG